MKVLLPQGIALFFCLELFSPENHIVSFSSLSNICSKVIFSKYLRVVFYLPILHLSLPIVLFFALYFSIALILISDIIYLHFHFFLHLNISPMRQRLLIIIIFTPVYPESQKSSIFDEQINK